MARVVRRQDRLQLLIAELSDDTRDQGPAFGSVGSCAAADINVSCGLIFLNRTLALQQMACERVRTRDEAGGEQKEDA